LIIVSISRAHHNYKQLTFINIVKNGFAEKSKILAGYRSKNSNIKIFCIARYF